MSDIMVAESSAFRVVSASTETIGLDNNGRSIYELAFDTTGDFVVSQDGKVADAITAIEAKYRKIEEANRHHATFGELRQRAKKDGLSYMNLDSRTFLRNNEIRYDRTGGDDKHSVDEWNINREYLNSWIKSRTNEVQTEITKLNDLVNKQNQLVQSRGTILKKMVDASESMLRNIL